MRIRIGKKYLWTVQPWQKVVAGIFGALLWTGAWVAFGCMLVEGFAFHAM